MRVNASWCSTHNNGCIFEANWSKIASTFGSFLIMFYNKITFTLALTRFTTIWEMIIIPCISSLFWFLNTQRTWPIILSTVSISINKFFIKSCRIINHFIKILFLSISVCRLFFHNILIVDGSICANIILSTILNYILTLTFIKRLVGIVRRRLKLNN